jgi:uncharacterized protein YecT (DUF1311 family)
MKRAMIAGLLLILGGAVVVQTQAGRRQSQQEMNQQAYKDFQTADKELNVAYAKLKKGLRDATMRAKLVNAQRAWLKFRDAESAFWASQMEGGSAYPLLYSGQQATLTRERTKELKEAYKEIVLER